MNCPYCGGNNVTPPKVRRGDRPSFAHGHCRDCGKRPRATVSWGDNDKMMYISYGRDGRKPIDGERRSVVMRVSPQEAEMVRSRRGS